MGGGAGVAFTFVGVGAHSYGGSGSPSNETVPLPNGWQGGDWAFLLVGALDFNETGNWSIGSTVTGWTLLGSSGNSVHGSRLFCRQLESGDSSPQISIHGGRRGAMIVVVRGATAVEAGNTDFGYYPSTFTNIHQLSITPPNPILAFGWWIQSSATLEIIDADDEFELVASGTDSSGVHRYRVWIADPTTTDEHEFRISHVGGGDRITAAAALVL